MRPRTPQPQERSLRGTRILAPRTLLACAFALVLNASIGSAATYYVDGASSIATDTGPGTSAQPYKTLQAAVTAFGLAGNTIMVRPATYREHVAVTVSGASSSPLVLEATGSGVVVSGSDDLSGTAKWAAFSGSAFVAPSVTWAPLQVFADGARLAPSAAPPASLPANSFVHVMGSGLYVNVGGPNPGSRKLEVGRRANGFRITGSHVTVQGFHVMNTEGDGVEVSSSTGTTIRDCRVSFANHQGIHVASGTSVLVYRNTVSENNDHGIYLTAGTNCRVAENESFLNARPLVRAANGVYVNGSTNCMVEGNRCHDNQDSGFQFYNGANNSTSRNNLSWNNGDHGFDHVRSSDVRHTNDVAHGNSRDGFSFEGDSPGGALFNCIAVDNGLTSNEFDLWIDATSMSGFQSNDNIIWNSTSQPVVKYGANPYTSVASFSSVSGTDTRTIQRDPLFTNPGAGTFTLSAGSPAIDNANAGAAMWPGRDVAGVIPFDDPGTPNAGIGAPPFADRGAFEFTIVSIPDQAPVVTAAATTAVAEGVMLTVALSVADPDGDPITSLTANLTALPTGHNAVFTPNASRTAGTLTWTPTYTDGRAAPYPVTFTATNALSGTASTSITVSNLDRAPVVTAPASATAIPSTPFSLGVTAADLDGDAIASLSADLTGLPAGHNAVFTPNASRTAGTLTWTPRASDGAGPYTVRFTAANALSATAVTSLRIDLKPVVTAPATATIAEASVLTLNITASDPDGSAITSLTANLSGLPPGNAAAFTVNAARTTGTFTWTPSFSDSRGTPYVITFTAGNSLPTTTSTSITVDNIDRAPAITSTATFAGVEGVRALIAVTALDPDGDAVTSLTADLGGLPASSNAVFSVNASKTIGTLAWTPTYIDGRIAPYAVTFRAANALSRTAVSSITVRDTPAPGTELALNSGFESSVEGWTEVGRASLTRATSGRSGSYSAQLDATTGSKNAFSLSDAPSAVDFVPTAGSTYRLSGWVRSSADVGTVRLEVAERLGGSQQGATARSGGIVLTRGWAPLTLDYVARAAGSSLDVDITDAPKSGHENFQIDDVSIKQISNGPADRSPVVTAFAGALVAEGGTLTMSVLASDLDGQPITSLAANLTALPVGHDAVFTTNAAKTVGTLTWTPSSFDSRDTPYLVIITAANALSGSAAVAITVQNVPGEPGLAHANASVVFLPGTAHDIAAGAVPVNSAPTEGFTPETAEASNEAAVESDAPKTPLAGEPGTGAMASELPEASASGASFSSHIVNHGRGGIDLRFSTRSSGRVKIQVFDVEGRRVGRPFNEFLPAGEHRTSLRDPGRTPDMGSGIYFYRVEAGGVRRKGRFAVVL